MRAGMHGKTSRSAIRYAKADAFNIAYQVVGDGPIDLVLSPGWATHLELAWDVPPLAHFLGELASFSRLILFDKRGTGLSDRFSSKDLPNLEQRMDDVRAVLNAVGSKRAVLFGSLGGGAMCGLFAASYPERTAGLILYGTFAKMQPNTGLLQRIADHVDAALDRVEQEWGRDSVGLAFWAPSVLAEPEVAESYLRLTRSSLSPAAARALMALGYQVDWEATLPAVGVPTLVLSRTGDLVVPVQQGRELARRITGAKFVELAGSDHLMWAGNQQAILDEVRAFVGGLESSSDATRVLGTIMFTDIAQSTELASRLGDTRWKGILHQHQHAVRRELLIARGHEIETAGDGFLATFDAPARAVRCAQAIVAAAADLGTPVRIGLHTGEYEMTRDGVRGIAVHIAARIASMADASEVRVSQTVRDITSGSGIPFADRGVHVLKGVPGEWRLFAALSQHERPGQED
jgi:class 3 adenylate cyclase